MAPPTKITLACVPEHFNIPMQLAPNLAALRERGIELDVRIAKGGTGEMVGLLEREEIDIAVALTEGLVAALANNADSKIRLIGTYVASPLNWGISVSPTLSPASELTDMMSIPLGSTITVSRMGSGSHVMAVVLEERIREAEKAKGGVPTDAGFGWDVAKDWEGMRKSIAEGKGKAMMWEYFTTKPWYDSGELRHLDTLTPPWPAFLLASTPSAISRLTPTVVTTFLSALTELTAAFKKGGASSIAHLTAPPFNYKPEDAEKWLAGTRWAERPGEIGRKEVELTVDVLRKAGMVKEEVEPSKWLGERVGKFV
ncbi:hypothetical protein DFJ74DRAFT_634555 [Hyaloraphidium curvatum]|nr:hypothetical protein DFJ74DRAFT_634555 [Hyaloraphidium curvatum]